MSPRHEWEVVSDTVEVEVRGLQPKRAVAHFGSPISLG